MIIHDGDVSLTTSTVRSLLRAWKAAVTSSNAPHISHAVFLPKWAKDNVWSQPVKAWNARRAFDFASPILRDMSCANKYFRSLPTPNSIQSSDTYIYLKISSAIKVLNR